MNYHAAEPSPGQTLPAGIEVFESPKVVLSDQAAFFIYAQDPAVDLPPEHFPEAYYSFVAVESPIVLGASKSHMTFVGGKVGEDMVYTQNIKNHVRLLGVQLDLKPLGYELALQTPRIKLAERRAHHSVRKVLKKLQDPDHDPLQTK